MTKQKSTKPPKRINKAPVSKRGRTYLSYKSDSKISRVAEQESTYARLEARVSPGLKQRIQHAANIQGRTLTDFMISSLEEITSRTIKQHQVVELSFTDQQAFVNALLKPPEPSPALKRAVARYKKLGL